MASTTVTLQSLSNFLSTHADLLSMSGVGGFNNEPFLTIYNDATSALLSSPNDWKINSVELSPFVNPLITMLNKQDYLFAGASAFTLAATTTSTPSAGCSIDLSSNSAITVTAGVVTVVTLETHRFAVGNTVYMVGNANSTYNSTFTDDGNSVTWASGWVITSVTAKSFTFAATAGQANGNITGASGITDLGWLTAAIKMELNNNSSPPNYKPLKAERNLPRWNKCSEPTKVAVIQDFGTGVLKIRLHQVPSSTIWAVGLVYQSKAPRKVALTDLITPFPDNFSYVVLQAVIVEMYRYVNSPLVTTEEAKLVRKVAQAMGYDQNEESNVYLEPEDSLVDWGPYGTGY